MVVFDEVETIFSCPYCRVRLFMLVAGTLRYCLPARSAPQEALVYVPYWRMRGLVFFGTMPQVEHRLLDSTILALKEMFFPFSAGLRPQAMRLRFAYAIPEARFLEHQIPFEEALKRMERGLVSVGAYPKTSVQYQSFVGEQVSLIYSPVYERQGSWFDAVLDRPLPKSTPGFVPMEAVTSGEKWPVSFIPTLCPYCGWDMVGDKSSVILFCDNCEKAWQSSREGFVETQLLVMPSGESVDAFLPFWRLSVEAEGIQLRTFADLARISNIPKAPRDAWSQERAYLWIPSFRINPTLFLRLAKQFSLAELQAVPDASWKGTSIFPVRLNRRQAEESVKVVLGHLAAVKKHIYPHLAKLRITILDAELVLVPCQRQGEDLVQPELGISLSRSSLAS